MQTLTIIDQIIGILFILCYSYQIFFIPLYFILKNRQSPPPSTDPPHHRLAVLICARNEALVIGDLLDSLDQQTYPKDLFHIFVMADNCTDATAAICQNRGTAAKVTVYSRFNKEKVGKGYALQALMQAIRRDYGNGFDGYLVFDADNILDKNYLLAMDRTFSEGHDIITSYRNSKNYGVNWISAGYALWFLRESRFLNHVRYLLHSSCAVSGTGFFFSRAVAEEIGDWPFHLLTEDIQFSVESILNGRKIAFCKDAILYDEQPVTFPQSFRQRLRWSKGYLQVFSRHGAGLIKGALTGNFSCFDMSMTIMPAFVLSLFYIVSNLGLGIRGAILGEDITIALQAFLMVFLNIYGILFVVGLITTITEWKNIQTTPVRKVLFAFTFPLFMATYIPISMTALLTKVDWKPIHHTYSVKKLNAIGEFEK